MKHSKLNKFSTLVTARPKQVALKVIYIIFAVMFFGQALAQLELKRFTINSGGSDMSGGGFELKSSIGQVDAGEPQNEGHGSGNYSLNGGFWQQNNDLIFKNKFQ